MESKNLITKIMAIVGTVLVWVPLVAPVVFSVMAFAENRHVFRFDYLMPLELFPVTLVGAALLIWAAIRARSQVKLICWSAGVVVAMLACGMLLAVGMGWASGRTEPGGAWFAVAQISIVVYCLAVVALGIGGILVNCNLFRKTGKVRK